MILVANNLYRSALPKDLSVLSSAVIETLISLETEWITLLTDKPRERQFPPDFGIKHYDFNFSFITAPKKWEVEKVLQIIADGDKTLVQCLSGVDRTGYICAVYRMQVQGWTYEAALKEWKAEGRHWPYAAWERSLKKWQLPDVVKRVNDAILRRNE